MSGLGLLKLTPVQELVGDQGHMRAAASEAGKGRKPNMGAGLMNGTCSETLWNTQGPPSEGKGAGSLSTNS